MLQNCIKFHFQQGKIVSIFPFVPNMFHSSSQWVPISNPIFWWGDCTRWQLKGFQSPKRGRRWKRGKKTRGGGRERHCGNWKAFGCHTNVVIKTFQSPRYYGDQKPFSRHVTMATKSLSITTCGWQLIIFNLHTLVAIKNLSISTCMWQLKGYPIALTKFDHL